jgi:hypothetical protein
MVPFASLVCVDTNRSLEASRLQGKADWTAGEKSPSSSTTKQSWSSLQLGFQV